MDDDGADEGGSIAHRLRRLWAAGSNSRFYELAYRTALPVISRKLCEKHRISDNDADDCVGTALDGFRRAADAGTVIQEPYAYIAASANNAAVTLHRQRQGQVATLVDFYVREDGRDPFEQLAASAALARWSLIAVEETLDDVEVEEDWAVALVEKALETLTPQSQAVLLYLAKQPFDLNRGDLDASSEAAAAALNMTRPAFRKAKERAYSRLREAIPAAAQQLGLILPPRFADAIFQARPSVPTQEED